MFFSLQFYIQVVEVLHYVSQKSNSFLFFIIGFLHIFLTSRKNKISFLKDQNLCKILPF